MSNDGSERSISDPLSFLPMTILNTIKSKFIGQRKEHQAAIWLKSQAIEIIAHNYLCKGGEIDLIGVEKNQQTNQPRLVFFEVKYRKSTAFGHPSEMVSPQQQQRLLRCAQRFLQAHPQYQDYPMQFDVLTFLDKQAKPERIKNALGF